jgi:hypothetical protein
VVQRDECSKRRQVAESDSRILGEARFQIFRECLRLRRIPARTRYTRSRLLESFMRLPARPLRAPDSPGISWTACLTPAGNGLPAPVSRRPRRPAAETPRALPAHGLSPTAVCHRLVSNVRSHHWNLAYSDFACMKIGMSGSASFQSVRKSR